MSGGRLPPSNAFSVGQRQPYLNHGGVNHFPSSPNHGAFVQPEKKGVGQEAQHTPVINNQAQSVSQEMNPSMRGKEMSMKCQIGFQKCHRSLRRYGCRFHAKL